MNVFGEKNRVAPRCFERRDYLVWRWGAVVRDRVKLRSTHMGAGGVVDTKPAVVTIQPETVLA